MFSLASPGPVLSGRMIRALPCFAAVAILSACATTQQVAQPAGSAIALGESVAVEEMSVTPLRVVEDSRCPINARCVWAGRLVVEAAIRSDGVAETREMTLGEPELMGGQSVLLSEVLPRPSTQTMPVAPGDYRFVFTNGSSD
ncbi:hypothetical protein [Aurantiacibacter aquimixticola]|uniref:Lipoprotein n=1 Tax=Aurantiacibacter aquimixticola TaxID=1958945 RepID=A0A419RSH4_9SPHN|nr:hypothetical protein [Aurantiacibacter aquimixticola]RJY08704.1 hypothetical protein D6201_04435 [Aurantiacibacter aquimixticola]